jgi:hypothetical protein
MDNIRNKITRVSNYFNGILIYEEECNFKYFTNITEVCKKNKKECIDKIQKFIKCKENN